MTDAITSYWSLKSFFVALLSDYLSNFDYLSLTGMCSVR